jgi:RNA polymerase sigma-70 factor, ECF subfamily
MRISHSRQHFEQTVRAYGADLFRYAYWLCRDRHLAEDLVQECFTRAWKSWGDLREPAQAKAWLMTILRNECMRSFSRHKAEIPSEDIAEGELPALPSFESGVETAEIFAMLHPTYREPLLLQVLGGFSCAEIAAMLGTTEGAVMTRLTRARQALRQQLTDAGKRRVAQ